MLAAASPLRGASPGRRDDR